MATKGTMNAVVFKGPRQIVIEKKPVPEIQDPRDIIVKVTYTALCGRCVLLPYIPLLRVKILKKDLIVNFMYTVATSRRESTSLWAMNLPVL